MGYPTCRASAIGGPWLGLLRTTCQIQPRMINAQTVARTVDCALAGC
jgi:hypothetical protein